MTGARINEITQLRREDLLVEAGVPCIRITPDAGSVKTDNFRIVGSGAMTYKICNQGTNECSNEVTINYASARSVGISSLRPGSNNAAVAASAPVAGIRTRNGVVKNNRLH